MAYSEEKAKEIIARELEVSVDQLAPEAKFIEDLGADSLDTVELVMALEEEFGLDIHDEDADKFKLMAKRMVRQAVWGVKLNEERQPPLELPAQGGLMYFRLNRAGSKMWDQARLDKGLAITIRGTDIDTSDFNITLYMTVPGGGAPQPVPAGGRP